MGTNLLTPSIQGDSSINNLKNIQINTINNILNNKFEKKGEWNMWNIVFKWLLRFSNKKILLSYQRNITKTPTKNVLQFLGEI